MHTPLALLLVLYPCIFELPYLLNSGMAIHLLKPPQTPFLSPFLKLYCHPCFTMILLSHRSPPHSSLSRRARLSEQLGDESNKLLRSNIAHLLALMSDVLVSLNGGMKQLIAKAANPTLSTRLKVKLMYNVYHVHIYASGVGFILHAYNGLYLVTIGLLFMSPVN